MINIIITCIYLFFTTAGIFMMKLGGDSLLLNLNKGIDFKIGYITLIGFMCYIVSFLIWQKLVITFDLSYIVPITAGIVQILILLLGYFFFKEKISLINVVGILIIIVGIILVVYKK